jgi:hypothetical protein
MNYARKPCDECPWRIDVPCGKFPPERFQSLASTAVDMAMTLFACHKSPAGKEFPCAGATIRQPHNLRLRLLASAGEIDPEKVSDGGFVLFANYWEMAVANGVPPLHPSLRGVRCDV